MRLTGPQRLQILMLCDIYEKLGIGGEIEPSFVRRAIFDDCEWAIGWRYSGIFYDPDPDPEPEVSETANLLEMYDALERAVDALPPSAVAQLDREFAPLGAKDIRFRGFDGNNETRHMGIARFLVEELGRFSAFKGRDFNSHMPLSLETDRRMFRIYDGLRRGLMGRLLSRDEIAQIWKERVHPENRR